MFLILFDIRLFNSKPFPEDVLPNCYRPNQTWSQTQGGTLAISLGVHVEGWGEEKGEVQSEVEVV